MYSGSGNTLIYNCPCGCGDIRSLPIKKVGSYLGGWGWNGNRDRPTLLPSIKHLAKADGTGCTWHGFLKDGNWETVL
jgi:hypothetical protein